MLDFAAAAARCERVAWRQADALALPFPDRSFDVVACQFGAMFFPDKVTGFREARRVLQPGGRFVFSVWDRIEDNEFADVVTQAVAALFPRRSAEFPGAHAARLPRQRRLSAPISQRPGSPASRSRRRAPQPCSVAARRGDRLLPGHAAAQRDRGARPVAPRRGDRCGRGGARARFGPGPIEGKIQALVITASPSSP